MFDTVLHALATAAASLVCVPVVVRVMAGSQVLDIPNQRSSHSMPVPLGGGIGMLVPCLVGMIILWVTGGLPLTGFPAALALGITGMAVIGFVDDLRDLPPRPRLLMEGALVAACLAIGGLRFESLAVPGFEIGLGWEGWLVAWLFVVGFTNMFNFMDGINGIAGFQTLIGAGGIAALGVISNDQPLALTMALLAGSAIGFLQYNFPRASVFMGDVGSLPIGFALAMGVLRLHSGHDGTGMPLWLPILTIWPFLFDASYTLINRVIRKRNPFRAHREHVYQRLVVAGASHTRVTLIYAVFMLLCTGAALLAHSRPDWGGYLFWLVFLTFLIWTISTMSRIRAFRTNGEGR